MKVFGYIKRNFKKVFYNYKNFGFRFGTRFLLSKIFRKNEYKTRFKAIDILEKQFGYVLDKYRGIHNDLSQVDEAQKNVFCLWWDGLEKAPLVVQKSYASIEEYFADYRVVLLTKDNYREYVDLDDNYLKLFAKEKISIQTLSDIIRFNVIEKYGGVWTDLTMWFFAKEPNYERIKEYGFYSINSKAVATRLQKYWGSKQRVLYWTTFYFAANKGNVILQCLNELYCEYYKMHDFCIDYYMNDYFLILCHKYHLADGALSKIPYTENDCFYLLVSLLNGQYRVSKAKLLASPQKLDWHFAQVNHPYTVE